MPIRVWLRLTEIALVTALLAAIVVSWRADRRDRAQLATQLAAAQQTIAAAADRQKDRDAQLAQTLAQLAAERKSALTPDQILKVLPQALSLPAPITQAKQSVGARIPGLSPEGSTSHGGAHTAVPAPGNNFNPEPCATTPSLSNGPVSRSGTAATPPNLLLPSADLKPLYDFAIDCQACQAKLATAQSDLADEKTKSASLTKERDAAVRTAKGGTALRRIARAAKWFLLGAAAGAIAAKATR